VGEEKGDVSKSLKGILRINQEGMGSANTWDSEHKSSQDWFDNNTTQNAKGSLIKSTLINYQSLRTKDKEGNRNKMGNDIELT